MEHATTKTTVSEVITWLSTASKRTWNTCTFLFDGYGRTKEFLRNENYQNKSKLMNTSVFDFLCSEKTIPVKVKSYNFDTNKRTENKVTVFLTSDYITYYYPNKLSAYSAATRFISMPPLEEEGSICQYSSERLMASHCHKSQYKESSLVILLESQKCEKR